jgi:hypothetical protein
MSCSSFLRPAAQSGADAAASGPRSSHGELLGLSGAAGPLLQKRRKRLLSSCAAPRSICGKAGTGRPGQIQREAALEGADDREAARTYMV